ncbi:alpha-ketoacid dehydrogenase subunit alpha/beta [Eilatimonas milleporae]|uniref:2-oxoglutarate dehydrogenase E1 component n=1 Tax=Eilatimonas milleporae TaxID=911205 RepID=A0A3M0CDK9_9PROT|nr:dehydrogenase E1 component subunit alpha/beta [Eilatimonas milleporae]RMB07914.1 2-oxoisovalerate dehydrogenase E1 component [Eilatimonas milleporae]
MTQLSTLGRDLALDIYRTMVRIAACDERIQQGLAAGDLQFQYYPAGGQEAIAAAIGALLTPEDYCVTTYRVIHDIVAKGTPVREIMAEMYGKETGTSRGKGGPMHLSDPKSGLMVTTGIVGAGAPIAGGLALAGQMKGTGRVTVCSFGDGAANIGAVHEALNMAALWRLPVVFVCQNNLYAEYTSFEGSTRSTDIAGRAAGYGMAGERCDGRDPVSVYEAAGRAIDRARAGDGPTLLECVAPRLQGHAFGSDQAHMDQARLAEDIANAPLKTVRNRLLEEALASETELTAIEDAARVEVDAAQTFAMESQSPAAAELYTEIFADNTLLPEGPGAGGVAADEPTPAETVKASFGEAVNNALDVALETDPDVFLLGEDIMDPAGGIVKATYGLSTKYGTERVRGTPISEQAIVGAAIGASLTGMKPVAEIMVCDFAMVCMDQIANHAAKLRYMSGGRTSVPVTLRMLTAGNVGSFGAQHSQSLESWFAHIPGLKIVAPSNAFDAKGLLLSCIHDPDPCISLEAMRCFFAPGEIGVGDYRVPIGKAAVRQKGDDVTLVSYSWGMQEVMGAAGALAEAGISAEIIDLRSIVPLDLNTVLASVGKTGRAVIVHPAVEFCGLGAELSAKIHENLFSELKAPVARLGARYTPIPFNQQLEALHFPTAEGIATTVLGLFGKTPA